MRRPDAGGHVQTRPNRTEARYRTRFAGMIRTLCKQYHGAIRQNLRDRWDDGSIMYPQFLHRTHLV